MITDMPYNRVEALSQFLALHGSDFVVGGQDCSVVS